MLGTIAILIGLLIAITKFLDEVYLTDQQKARLQSWSVRAWNWLDDAKKHSLLSNLRTRRGRLAVSAITFLIVFGWLIDDPGELLLSLVALPIIYAMLTWTLAARTRSGITLRLFALLGVAVLPVLVAVIHPGPQVALPYLVWDVETPLGMVVGLLLAFVLIVLWLSIFLPILAIVAASAMLSIAEFCVRRVAESPKGVVLSFSTFLGLGGAVLKAFGYS